MRRLFQLDVKSVAVGIAIGVVPFVFTLVESTGPTAPPAAEVVPKIQGDPIGIAPFLKVEPAEPVKPVDVTP